MKIRSTLIVLSLVLGLFACSYNSGVLKEAQPAQQNTNLKTASAQGHFHMFLKAVNNSKFVAGGGILVHIDLVQKGNSNKEKRVAIYDSAWNGAEHFNDLLDMSTGIMLDVANGLVTPPPASYDYAVATVVPGSGWITDTNNVTYPVKFPDNKFMLAFKPAIKITSGGVSTDVVLQIDIDHSFVRTGNSYIFKPVVKVVNATTKGSLVGGVYTNYPGYGLVPVGGATISLDGAPVFTISDQPITDPTTGYTLDPGQYWIPGLPAGIYTVSASADGYQPASAQDTIVEGNFTQQVFILTPQKK